MFYSRGNGREMKSVMASNTYQIDCYPIIADTLQMDGSCLDVESFSKTQWVSLDVPADGII